MSILIEKPTTYDSTGSRKQNKFNYRSPNKFFKGVFYIRTKMNHKSSFGSLSVHTNDFYLKKCFKQACLKAFRVRRIRYTIQFVMRKGMRSYVNGCIITLALQIVGYNFTHVITFSDVVLSFPLNPQENRKIYLKLLEREIQFFL